MKIKPPPMQDLVPVWPTKELRFDNDSLAELASIVTADWNDETLESLRTGLHTAFDRSFYWAHHTFNQAKGSDLKKWLKATARQVRDLSKTLGVPHTLDCFTESTGMITRSPYRPKLFGWQLLLLAKDTLAPIQWIEELGTYPVPSDYPDGPNDVVFWQLAELAANIIGPDDASANRAGVQSFVGGSRRQLDADAASENVAHALRMVPAVLALVAGACDRAQVSLKRLPVKDTTERTFRRRLFSELRDVHATAFGSPVKLQDSVRMSGPGVKWAQKVIDVASKLAESIPPDMSCKDIEWRTKARQLLLDAADLKDVAVEQRLRGPARLKRKRRL